MPSPLPASYNPVYKPRKAPASSSSQIKTFFCDLFILHSEAVHRIKAKQFIEGFYILMNTYIEIRI